MDLKDKIKEWIARNPDRAYSGNRMVAQLHRVRTEFKGLDAIRLEELVAETFERQLYIDVSRAQNLEAANKLADSIQELKDELNNTKPDVQKLSVVEQGIEAAAHKITTKKLTKDEQPNRDLSFVPKVPKLMDKSLN
jgi:ABC-type phosphate transport system auxiliary subunit